MAKTRVSTFPAEILQDVKLSTCSELIIFWNGVSGNDWILAYDQVSNFSILKRRTNVYYDKNEKGKHLFRPGRTSKPLMNLSQDCWCCGQGGTMPTTSYSKTTNGLYAWLTTNEQRCWLRLSTVAHSAWQTASTEEGLSRGTAPREDQSVLRAGDLTVVSSCNGKLSAVPNGDLILNCQSDTKTNRNLLKLKDRIDPHNLHLNCEANTTSLTQYESVIFNFAIEYLTQHRL